MRYLSVKVLLQSNIFIITCLNIMKVIDWNQPATFTDLFSKIYIHSLNNGCFDQNNPTWISYALELAQFAIFSSSSF